MDNIRFEKETTFFRFYNLNKRLLKYHYIVIAHTCTHYRRIPRDTLSIFHHAHMSRSDLGIFVCNQNRKTPFYMYHKYYYPNTFRRQIYKFHRSTDHNTQRYIYHTSPYVGNSTGDCSGSCTSCRNDPPTSRGSSWNMWWHQTDTSYSVHSCTSHYTFSHCTHPYTSGRFRLLGDRT